MKFLKLTLLIAVFNGFSAFGQEDGIEDLYKFYQDFISDTRGGKCPMFPSCSKYSVSSFRNDGPLVGWFNTADRLMRCGHEHRLYPFAFVNGEAKLIDPAVPGELDSLLAPSPKKRFGKNLEFYREKNDTTFFLSLINSGLYDAAVTEYHRIKHFGKEDEPSLILEYNYLVSLAALGEYEKIIYNYEFKLDSLLKPHPLILLEVAESWFHLDNYQNALDYTLQIPPSSAYKDNSNLFKGYVYAHQNDWKSAEEAFQQVGADYAYHDFAEHNIRIVHELSQFRRKNPAVAGILSVVPGGGYLYTGHKTTAISSFVLNSLFAYATYTSFKTQNYGIGILTGVFSTSFYIGNITGGIKSANRYNEAKKNQLKRKLMYSTNK